MLAKLFFRNITRIGLLVLAVLFCLYSIHYFSTDGYKHISHVVVQQQGEQLFGLQFLTSESEQGSARTYQLHGDQFRIDAVIGAWPVSLTSIGVTPRFRIQRLQGRYVSAEDELNKPRSVFTLSNSMFGLQQMSDTLLDWVGLDFIYGSSAYIPMLDGARYSVYLKNNALFITSDTVSNEQLIPLF